MCAVRGSDDLARMIWPVGQALVSGNRLREPAAAITSTTLPPRYGPCEIAASGVQWTVHPRALSVSAHSSKGVGGATASK